MKIPEDIFVVGCGGTGSWSAILAAMMGVKIIHLADHDVIEKHNLSRLPFKEGDIGRPKTEVLKEFILSIRPDCTVYIYGGIHSEMDLFVLTGEVIFDCNDNPEIQKMIFKYCEEYRLKYIGVGCNADHLSVIDNLDFVNFGSGDPYEVTPMFVIPAIIASSSGLWNLVKGKEKIIVSKKLSDILEDK